jgi:DNA helicase-2/ATP-dependent DNA helicase PcrA
VVALEQNYRSGQRILDTANAIAAQADRSYRVALHSARDAGVAPGLVFCRDESAQAALVCDAVLEARERGMELRAQAVLMRTSHDSALLEMELSRRQIPFVKYGGLKYMEAAHVKDLMALFRLVGNPANELAWVRILQLLEGVGPVTARRVLDVLVSGPTGGSVLARWPAARERLPAPARERADAVVSGLIEGGSPGVQAERLRDAVAPLIQARYPDGFVRLADLDQLVAGAREARDLGTFAAELALDPPQSSADLAGPPHLDEDYLVLSTIHSAKGLEWDGVHVLAVYDGNFPACMSAGSAEEIDEERRLLYVAVTRARRSLHMYVPVRYYHRPQGIDDAHGYGKPSRFLTDAVQRTCAVVPLPDGRAGEDPGSGGPGGRGGRDGRAARRITVSVDSLFR